MDRAREAVDEIVRLLPACPPELRPGLHHVVEIIAQAFDEHPASAEEFRSRLNGKSDRALRLQSLSADRAQELLAADPDTRARTVHSDGERIVRDLAALGRPDLILRLLTGVTGLLGDPARGRRLAAIEALHAVKGVWDDPGFAPARSQLQKDVRRSLERETDPQVYERLADFAGFIVGSHLRRNEARPSLEILSILSWQQPTHEAAGHAIDLLLGGGALEPYSKDILAGEPTALRLLEAFGEAAPRQILLQVRLAESAPARLRLGKLLSRTGSAGAALLAEELRKNLPADEALRLLDILHPALSDAEATSALGSLLQHASAQVRSKVISLLAERGVDPAGDVLLRSLGEEKEPPLRLELVDALGRVRAAGAVDTLARIADSRQESEELRTAACTSLGRIGGDDAIRSLSALASRSAHGLGALLRPSSPAVRMAALRALGAYVSDLGIRGILEKAAADGDPTIASAAREALSDKLQRAFLNAGRTKPPADLSHSR